MVREGGRLVLSWQLSFRHSLITRTKQQNGRVDHSLPDLCFSSKCSFMFHSCLTALICSPRSSHLRFSTFTRSFHFSYIALHSQISLGCFSSLLYICFSRHSLRWHVDFSSYTDIQFTFILLIHLCHILQYFTDRTVYTLCKARRE